MFKAVDAAGNEALTEKITVKLDTQVPVIGDISYAQKETEMEGWIIGKDRLIISIPVTEEGSGAEQIRYDAEPFGDQSVTKTAELIKGSDGLTGKEGSVILPVLTRLIMKHRARIAETLS